MIKVHRSKTGIWLLPLLLLFFISCENHKDIQKTKSVFYIIQPAEHYHAFDGHLSWYGRLRAGDLMRYLKDSGIQKIYVTPFSRSFETIDSLRLLQRIDTVEYIVDSTGNNLLPLLKERSDLGRKVLIVARPFAIPNIIRKLGASFNKDSVSKEGFNVIYKVINDHGKAVFQQQKFGRPPKPTHL